MSWHVDPDSIDGYLRDELSDAYAASVEAHLLACSHCRSALARTAGTAPSAGSRHEDSWSRIAAEVDQPRLTRLERLLGRLGVPYADARLAVGTPSLRRAWWLAGMSLLAFAAVLAHVGSGTIGTVTFVVTAPVMPLVGVALSYGIRSDPAGDVVAVAPYRSFRLVVLRSLLVLLSWLPAAGVLALALPTHPAVGLLWFIPGVALCCLTLAASTFVDPLLAAGVLGSGWCAAAALTVRGPRWMPAGQLLEQFVAFRPLGQVLLAALAVIAVLLTAARRTAFDTWRTS